MSTDARLRVLFVITDLEVGGAERMLLKLASRMAARHDLAVVSLTGRGEMAPLFEDAGIPASALHMRGLASLPGAVVRLAREIRRWRPQVVNTWMYHADLVGGLAARLAGLDAIAWNIRNSDLSAAHTSRATRAVVRASALVSGIVPRRILCCSENAKRIHVALGYRDSDFQVLPNGFDLEQYQPSARARAEVRDELGLDPDALLVGLVARWHPQKNHAGFLQAASALARRLPNVHFVLAGSECDADNPELVRLVANTGHGERIHLLGQRSDVPRLTAAFDVASSASIFGEAFPNILGEAMACAVPCVTTDVGDSAAIVGETGLVVPPDDPAALAEAWYGLLALPAAARRELGERGRERVQREFELGAVAARYETVFRDIAQARARQGERSRSCAE